MPQESTGNVMTSEFWDEHGIIYRENHASEYYLDLMKRLNEEIKNKWSQM